ncbi:MAG: hypothetical protein ACTHLC_11290 [Rhizobiaceae bacterium]
MVSRAVRLCGTESADPPSRTLRAGTLSAELDNGALRYIRIGRTEVIRAIAFLVRDENWGTFTPVVEDLKIDEAVDGFSVSYRATCSDAVRTLVYEAQIRGGADGSLSFEVVAEPKTDVETNRTGFIVLHPLEGVAGEPVKVLHVDGKEEISKFPEAIDPMCPFKDIRALSHEIAPGVWATCTMEGDTFEMEDQRNWSDASYKTYVRPLARPWPYVLPKGQEVKQAVRLTVSGTLPPPSDRSAQNPVRIEIGERSGTFPRLGLGVSADEAAHALDRIDLVKRLDPEWLVCQVDLRKEGDHAELAAYRRLAETTGAEIVLEIITAGKPDPLAELKPLATAVDRAGLKPAAISVFPAQDMKSVLPGSPWPEMPTFAEIYAAARMAFPKARLGGGMATYFTELNRKRPPAELIDYVTHTTCPNVHAPDDRSVMETIETLPYQILSTRSFMGDRIGYRVGPSQLGCRENPYGKSTAPNPDNRRVCLSRIDPRQRGLFNAAWMVGYAAALAKGGIEAIALGAPTGPFGHIYRRTDFAQPYFDALDGSAVYPGFHVFAGLSRLSGKPLLDVRLSDKGKIAALAVEDRGKTVLWLANLTADRAIADIPALAGRNARIVVLNADAFEPMTTTPDFLDSAAESMPGSELALDAYAVARIEIG